MAITVGYNLKTGDCYFDGKKFWHVLDTYPNSIRARRICYAISFEMEYSYEQVNGSTILESPGDYDSLDLRDISRTTAEWLARQSDLSDYAVQKVYDRIVIGWPSVDAYGYLAANPATPQHILWSLLSRTADLAAIVAGNPKLAEPMANTLARHSDAYVRRHLARNAVVIQSYPGVVEHLRADDDLTVTVALQATIDNL